MEPSNVNPTIPSGARAATLLAFAGLLGACSSTPEVPEGVPLPFHVALIPTEIHDTSVLTETPSEPVWPEQAEQSSDDDMRLELTTAGVSQALRDELGHAFVRTTLLELPPESAELSAKSPLEREQYWQERAREAGADLLVRTRLLHNPVVDGRRNEKFWLNLPLFLLGGPMCYFVSDRSYESSARLQAEVFDVSEGHESLADYALLTIPLYTEAGELDLRFLDRAEGAKDYAFSFLIPAGLLARETEDVEAEVEARLPLELGRGLAAKVFAQRSELEQNLALGTFKLDAEAARLEPGTEGKLRVRVPVQELAGPGGLHRYELCAGGEVLTSGDFASGSSPDGRGLIDEELALPAGIEFLTVRVTDAGANTRSYTLPIAAPR